MKFDCISGVGLVNLLSFVHSNASQMNELNRFVLVKNIEPFERERGEETLYGITIEIREWDGTSDILLKVYKIIDEDRKAFP